MSLEEVRRRSDERYDHPIRQLVETEENICKLISIDMETGGCEITAWLDSPSGSKKLLVRHPNAELIQIRIGYPVVETFGGIRLMPVKLIGLLGLSPIHARLYRLRFTVFRNRVVEYPNVPCPIRVNVADLAKA